MPHALTPYAMPYVMNDWLFTQAVSAIPESKGDLRLHPGTNTPRGVAVHLVMARHSLCELLGGKPPALPWKDVGEMFDAGFKEGGERPELATVLGAWKALEPVFHKALASAPAEVLAKPSPLPIPGLEKPTVADFAALNVVHESYHLGQLGLITKGLTGKRVMNPEAVGVR